MVAAPDAASLDPPGSRATLVDPLDPTSLELPQTCASLTRNGNAAH
jgi:hypothetical protein